jgi:hypothetical protein
MTQTQNNMTAVEIEFNKRANLAQNKTFIAKCILLAKKMNVSATDWNKDKICLLMAFANQAILIAQENGLDTFGVENPNFKIA